MSIEFRKDLFEIFQAITPQQIQENKLIRDSIEVFCEVIEELAPMGVNIHAVFDEPEFRKEFLRTYNGTLMQSMQNMKRDSRYIAERDAFFEEYGVLPINEDLMDSPELTLTSEDMNAFRSFYEEKGLFRGINFVHSWLLEHLNIEDKKELRIVEGRPFEFRVTGKVPEVIYNYLIRSIAHPLGFVYAYFEGSMVNPSSDYYWNVEAEYVFSYFKMTYLLNDEIKSVDLTYEIKSITNGVVEYAWYEWDEANDDWLYNSNGKLIEANEGDVGAKRKKHYFYDISTIEFDNTDSSGNGIEDGYVGTKTIYKIKNTLDNTYNARIEIIRNRDAKYNIVRIRGNDGAVIGDFNDKEYFLETENSYFLKIGDTTVIDHNFYVADVVHMSDYSNDAQLQFEFHGYSVKQKYNNTVNEYDNLVNPYESADSPLLAYYDVNRDFENYDKVLQHDDYDYDVIEKRKNQVHEVTEDGDISDEIEIGTLGWFSSLSTGFVNEKYENSVNPNISFTPQPVNNHTFKSWYKEDKQFKYIGQNKYLSNEPLKIGDVVNGEPTKIGRGVFGFSAMPGFRLAQASNTNYANNTIVSQELRFVPLEEGGAANFVGDPGLFVGDPGLFVGAGVAEGFDEDMAFNQLFDSLTNGTNEPVVDSGIAHYNFPRPRILKSDSYKYTFYNPISPRQQEYNKMHFKASVNYDADPVNLQFYCTEYFSIKSIS